MIEEEIEKEVEIKKKEKIEKIDASIPFSFLLLDKYDGYFDQLSLINPRRVLVEDPSFPSIEKYYTDLSWGERQILSENYVLGKEKEKSNSSSEKNMNVLTSSPPSAEFLLRKKFDKGIGTEKEKEKEKRRHREGIEEFERDPGNKKKKIMRAKKRPMLTESIPLITGYTHIPRKTKFVTMEKTKLAQQKRLTSTGVNIATKERQEKGKEKEEQQRQRQQQQQHQLYQPHPQRQRQEDQQHLVNQIDDPDYYRKLEKKLGAIENQEREKKMGTNWNDKYDVVEHSNYAMNIPGDSTERLNLVQSEIYPSNLTATCLNAKPAEIHSGEELMEEVKRQKKAASGALSNFTDHAQKSTSSLLHYAPPSPTDQYFLNLGEERGDSRGTKKSRHSDPNSKSRPSTTAAPEPPAPPNQVTPAIQDELESLASSTTRRQVHIEIRSLCTVESDLNGVLSPTNSIHSNSHLLKGQGASPTDGNGSGIRNGNKNGNGLSPQHQHKCQGLDQNNQLEDDDLSVNTGAHSLLSMGSAGEGEDIDQEMDTMMLNSGRTSRPSTRKAILRREKLQIAQEMRLQSTINSQKVKEEEEAYHEKAKQRLQEKRSKLLLYNSELSVGHTAEMGLDGPRRSATVELCNNESEAKLVVESSGGEMKDEGRSKSKSKRLNQRKAISPWNTAATGEGDLLVPPNHYPSNSSNRYHDDDNNTKDNNNSNGKSNQRKKGSHYPPPPLVVPTESFEDEAIFGKSINYSSVQPQQQERQEKNQGVSSFPSHAETTVDTRSNQQSIESVYMPQMGGNQQQQQQQQPHLASDGESTFDCSLDQLSQENHQIITTYDGIQTDDVIASPRSFTSLSKGQSFSPFSSADSLSQGSTFSSQLLPQQNMNMNPLSFPSPIHPKFLANVMGKHKHFAPISTLSFDHIKKPFYKRAVNLPPNRLNSRPKQAFLDHRAGGGFRIRNLNPKPLQYFSEEEQRGLIMMERYHEEQEQKFPVQEEVGIHDLHMLKKKDNGKQAGLKEGGGGGDETKYRSTTTPPITGNSNLDYNENQLLTTNGGLQKPIPAMQQENNNNNNKSNGNAPKFCSEIIDSSYMDEVTAIVSVQASQSNLSLFGDASMGMARTLEHYENSSDQYLSRTLYGKEEKKEKENEKATGGKGRQDATISQHQLTFPCPIFLEGEEVKKTVSTKINNNNSNKKKIHKVEQTFINETVPPTTLPQVGAAEGECAIPEPISITCISSNRNRNHNYSHHHNRVRGTRERQRERERERERERQRRGLNTVYMSSTSERKCIVPRSELHFK